MPTVNTAVVSASTTYSLVVTYRRFGGTCSHRGERIISKFDSSMLNLELFIYIYMQSNKIHKLF